MSRAVPAHAAGVQLRWSAPAECPTATHAQHALNSLIGQAPTSIEVAVTLSGSEGAYRAQIAFSGGLTAQRELSGARCRSLSEAALLVAAVMVDPLAVVEAVPAPPQLEAPMLEPPRAQLQLGFGVRGDLGSLPGPALGPGVQLSLSYGRWVAALEAAWWVPRVVLRGPRPMTGGEFGLWDAGLRATYALIQGSSVDLGPSAAFALGASWGDDVRLRNGNPAQHELFPAVFLGGRLRYRERRLFVELGADLGLLLRPAEYAIEDYDVIFRQKRWFGRASLVVGWSLS